MTRASQPSAFLASVVDELPRGSVLEVAVGEGRNALFLASRGFDVYGIDRSEEALARAREEASRRGLDLKLVRADLEDFPLPRDRFDVVVDIRYLQRSLIPAMKAALKPGGRIVFETFTVEQLARGHPRNPAFVLEHGELLRWFSDFRILRWEEGELESESGPLFLARLLAEKPRS
ncbi:MAG: type 12 methyltransferase [Candidatus Binatia bacterium]|nr:MAG: type 12 methyltransferase [Candidatus Binatia bacterium]